MFSPLKANHYYMYDIVQLKFMVPISFWRTLQSNSQNCECLKYVWNVYCVAGITNHGTNLNKFVQFQMDSK